jgi:hypothetical protein
VGGEVVMEHEGPFGLYKRVYLEVAKISLAYWSRFWCISVYLRRRDGPVVPNPKKPPGNGFLKVCAKFLT